MLKSAVLLQDKTTYLLARIRSGYKPKSHLSEYPEILLSTKKRILTKQGK